MYAHHEASRHTRYSNARYTILLTDDAGRHCNSEPSPGTIPSTGKSGCDVWACSQRRFLCIAHFTALRSAGATVLSDPIVPTGNAQVISRGQSVPALLCQFRSGEADPALERYLLASTVKAFRHSLQSFSIGRHREVPLRGPWLPRDRSRYRGRPRNAKMR